MPRDLMGSNASQLFRAPISHAALTYVSVRLLFNSLPSTTKICQHPDLKATFSLSTNLLAQSIGT